MSITAMKQALEALEEIWSLGYRSTGDRHKNAITSLRQAIEQAEKQDGDCQQCGGKGCVACDAREQEPVAWQWLTTAHFRKKLPKDAEKGAWNPLYTHPPKREWVGLTAEEYHALADKAGCMSADWIDFAKSIEQALKEKNT